MPTDEIFGGGDPLFRLLKRRREQADANIDVTPDSERGEDEFFPQLKDGLRKQKIPAANFGTYFRNRIQQRENVLPRNWRGVARDEFVQDADEIFALELSKAPNISKFASRRSLDEGVAPQMEVAEFYNNETVQAFINDPSNAEIKKNIVDRMGNNLPEEFKLAVIAGAYNEEYAKKYLRDPSYFRNLFQDKKRQIKELEDELENAGLGTMVAGELASGIVPLDQTEGALLGASVVMGVAVGAATKGLPILNQMLAVGASESALTYGGYFLTGAVDAEKSYRGLGVTSEENREFSIAEEQKKADDKSLDEGVRQRASENVARLEAEYEAEDEFVASVEKERYTEVAAAGVLSAGFTGIIVGAGRWLGKGDAGKQAGQGGKQFGSGETFTKIDDNLYIDGNGNYYTVDDGGNYVPHNHIDPTEPKPDPTPTPPDKKPPKPPKKPPPPKPPRSDVPHRTDTTKRDQDVNGFWYHATDKLRKADNIENNQAALFFVEVDNTARRNRIAEEFSNMPDNIRDYIKILDQSGKDDKGNDAYGFGTKLFIEAYGRIKGKDKHNSLLFFFTERARQESGIEAAIQGARQKAKTDIATSGDNTPVASKIAKDKEDAVLDFNERVKAAKDTPSDISKVDVETLRVETDGSVKYDVKGKEGDPVESVTVEGIEVHKFKVPEELHPEQPGIDKFIYRGYIGKPNADNPIEATNIITSGGDAKAVALTTLAHRDSLDSIMIAPQVLRIGNATIVKRGPENSPIYELFDTATGDRIGFYNTPKEAIDNMVTMLSPNKHLTAYDVFTKCMTGKSFVGAGKNAEDVLAASKNLNPGTALRGVAERTDDQIEELRLAGVFAQQEFSKGILK